MWSSPEVSFLVSASEARKDEFNPREGAYADASVFPADFGPSGPIPD